MELREGFEQKKLNLQNEYNKGERARKDRLCEFKKQLELERRASIDAHQQKLREVNRQFSVDRMELENERQTAYAKAKALQDSWVADTAPLHD